MRTRLILIRHAATGHNIQKRYCGWTDAGLSKEGKYQAALLGRRLKSHDIHSVYSSDRQRALESAKIIFKMARIQKIPQLNEMCFGVFEGLTHRQVLKRYPRVYKKWLSDPFSVSIKGAEDINAFKKRVLKAFEKIIRLNRGRTAAVVCHGGPIGVLVNDILKSKSFWQNMPSSTGVTVIEYKNNKPRIVLFNDTSHLDG
jgi:broad specificity phosphatase PhoE